MSVATIQRENVLTIVVQASEMWAGKTSERPRTFHIDRRDTEEFAGLAGKIDDVQNIARLVERRNPADFLTAFRLDRPSVVPYGFSRPLQNALTKPSAEGNSCLAADLAIDRPAASSSSVLNLPPSKSVVTIMLCAG